MATNDKITTFAGKNILICGATGFIGRNILEYFAAADTRITAVCHKRPAFDTPNNVRWIQADLRDPTAVNQLVPGHHILIQAAATTSGSKEIVNSPYLHVTDNAVMNSHLLRACYDHALAQFVFFSCSVMYPSSDKPVRETDFKGNIEGNYFGAGWTKVYLERMCEFYAGLGRTKHTVIRHSNIYGPHDKFDIERSHVCGATISKVQLAEKQLTVWGDGSESRDLLYIDDLVDFVEKTLTQQQDAYGLYNCGLGEAISIKDLARLIIVQSGKDVAIDFDQSKPTIPFTLALDCSKARRHLGWSPRVPLNEGLSRTINWWQQNIDPATLALSAKK